MDIKEILQAFRNLEYEKVFEGLLQHRPNDAEHYSIVVTLRSEYFEIKKLSDTSRLSNDEKFARMARVNFRVSGIIYDIFQAEPRPLRILFLAANPTSTQQLRLDEEIRSLRLIAQSPGNQRELNIQENLATRREELLSLILETKPHIIHFAGHGYLDSENNDAGLVFENDHGTPSLLGFQKFSDLIELINSVEEHSVECLILNGCNTEAISDFMPPNLNETLRIIGMRHAVLDTTAIAFSKGFYIGLSNGLSIEDAFKAGVIRLNLTGSKEISSPILI